MTVKLALLKSGEDVIADIQEMVIEEKIVGYFFENPCVAKVFAFDTEESGQTKTPSKLQLTSWVPLTSDKKIPVPLDWVITIVEPISALKEMYEKSLSTREVKNGKESD
jgi:hypothetical protein